MEKLILLWLHTIKIHSSLLVSWDQTSVHHGKKLTSFSSMVMEKLNKTCFQPQSESHSILFRNQAWMEFHKQLQHGLNQNSMMMEHYTPTQWLEPQPISNYWWMEFRFNTMQITNMFQQCQWNSDSWPDHSWIKQIQTPMIQFSTLRVLHTILTGPSTARDS